MSQCTVIFLWPLLLLSSAPSAIHSEVTGTCVHGHGHPLGMQSGAIPDSSITASSYLRHDDGDRVPHNARLGGPRFWANGAGNPWIQVDLKEPHTLTGIQTEGNYNNDEYNFWVQEITLKSGMRSYSLSDIIQPNGKVRTIEC